MTDCIFCKIIAGEIPSKRVYEDDKIIVINDVAPAAPVHILIIPKEHTENILTAPSGLVLHVQEKLPEILSLAGVGPAGFRLVINTGDEGGQTVKHLHFHILAGKAMGWPPC
ncbi:MAG: histidine triad nucleotide-binding protein [Acidaminococcaceae bacterium]|jgi:histidine triad (HIT) family protein|nr:histidine triad nucleotide-binding protein [Acidaminococcaceae bacterium]